MVKKYKYKFTQNGLDNCRLSVLEQIKYYERKIKLFPNQTNHYKVYKETLEMFILTDLD